MSHDPTKIAASLPQDENTTPEHATESLRVSEMRYRRLFESARDGILILDADSRQITDVNPYMVEMLEYSREEFLGKELWQIGLLKDEAASQEVYRELQESGYVRYEDLPLETKSGRRWEVEFVCNIYQENGHQVIQCNIRDITARKEAEATRSLLSSIVDSVDVSVVSIDFDRTITSWNKGAEVLYGYTAEEALGQSWTLLTLPEVLQQVLINIERIKQSQRVETFETEEVCKDGRHLQLSITLSPIKNAAGEVVGVSTLARDIGAQKQAEAALLESEKSYRLLADNSPDVISRIDQELRHIFVSPAIERLVSIPPTAFLGKTNREMGMSEALVLQWERRLRRVFDTGQAATGEFEFPGPDGSMLHFESRSIPEFGVDGTVNTVLSVARDITARKQAEEALHEQKELLQIIFDHIPVMISFYDANGKYQLANREWERTLGWSLEERRSHPNMMAEFYPDSAERQRVIDFMRQASGESAEFKTTVRDGRILDTSWVNIRLPDGKCIGIGQDITECKRSETARRVADEKFRTLFNAIDEGFCIIEMLFDENHKPVDYRFLETNPSFEKQTGIEDAQGRTMREIAPQLEDYWVENYGRVAATGDPVRFESFAAALGRWFDVYAFPVGDSPGPKVGIIFADSTTRKQVETALRESEESFRTAIEAIPQQVWTARPDGALDYVNRRILDYFGRTFEATVDSGWTDMVHPDDLPECTEKWQHALTTGEPYQAEFRLQKSGDDAYFPFIVRALPQRDHEGNITKWFGSNTDISFHKHAEAALQAAKAEAERANLAKSEFLSRMSHELRTPMNAILGFAQLLEMDDLNPEQAQGVGQILKGGRHLLDLINEVLDIARIESGQMEISPEPVAVAEVVGETLDFIRPLAAASGISLHDEIGATCPFHVRADRQRLRQVLLNLVANAVKYNREGGTVTLTCRQSVRSEEGGEPDSQDRRQEDGGRRQKDKEQASGETSSPTLCLEITDTGLGIAPQSMSRLFMPFERLGAEHGAVEGTGVGLALSKRLVELMGGRITAQSTLGEGSTFTVELPLTESPSDTSPADLSTPDSHAPHASSTTSPITHTVLYIEDNLSNRSLVESILLRHPSIALLSSTHGKLGLELARAHRPDLILLDLHLPDINGDEVLHRLQAETTTRDIPVVMLSADATPGQIERLLQAGAKAYLTKPLNVKQFLQVLQDTLETNG